MGSRSRFMLNRTGAWKTDIKVSMTVLGIGEEGEGEGGAVLAWQAPGPRTDLAEDLRSWMEASPRLACEWEPCCGATDVASLISPRSGFRRSRQEAAACRRRACPGS